MEKDEPAPTPAMLKPKLAISKNTPTKLTPADRSTARTSMNASFVQYVHGVSSRLTGPLEEFEKFFGIGHEPVHGLLDQTVPIDEIAKPGSDVAEVRRVDIFEVKTRRRHLVLELGSCGLNLLEGRVVRLDGSK